jgi:hypothetical protein
MRVTEVVFEKRKNLGQFEHELLRVTVELAEGESATTAINRAKATVEAAFSPADFSPVIS